MPRKTDDPNLEHGMTEVSSMDVPNNRCAL